MGARTRIEIAGSPRPPRPWVPCRAGRIPLATWQSAASGNVAARLTIRAGVLAAVQGSHPLESLAPEGTTSRDYLRGEGLVLAAMGVGAPDQLLAAAALSRAALARGGRLVGVYDPDVGMTAIPRGPYPWETDAELDTLQAGLEAERDTRRQRLADTGDWRIPEEDL